ncbi:hypothetical protein GCM10027040_29590 [Halomonas shantousis]
MSAATLLSGCFYVNTSQVPMATTYPITEQQKMQAAHHWDVLAQHEAQQILTRPSLRDRPLFVAGNTQTTPFANGFDDLLISRLVSSGAIVRTDPLNAAQVHYSVQVVKHKDRGYIRESPGTWTALSTGIAVATLPINHWNEPALALIPAAGIVDLFSGNWTELSHEEVIITTQVTDNNRILYSSSNIYYINAGDDDHYESGTKTIPVTNRW